MSCKGFVTGALLLVLGGCGAANSGKDVLQDMDATDTSHHDAVPELPDLRADLSKPPDTSPDTLHVDTIDTVVQPCTDNTDCLPLDKDANLCNGGWFCEDGFCAEQKEPLVCNDSILSPLERQCSTVHCDGKKGECVKQKKAPGTECDDGLLCTDFDSCVEGVCAGEPKRCKTENPCYPNVCVEETGDCVKSYLGEGAACDDDVPCTVDEKCVAGVCKGVAKVCGEAPQCKQAVCNQQSGECEQLNVEDTTPCDDGNLCTLGDACSGGECKGTPRDCSPIPLCYDRYCDTQSGLCVAKAMEPGTACDDGLFCTVNDQCNGAGCVGGQRDCPADSQCKTGLCNESLDRCEVQNKGDWTGCDDKNPCTSNDHCIGGSCVSTPKDCPVNDLQCQSSSCNVYTGACVVNNRPDGTGCNDGNPCVVNDNCQGGLCKGVPKTCPDPGACKTTWCNIYDGVCKVENLANGIGCDDGKADTVNDRCLGGVCTGDKPPA